MKDTLSYNDFKKIMNEEDGHNWQLIMDVNRKERTSLIYIGFDNKDFFIETQNSNIDLELYGDNHITSKSKIYLYATAEDFLKSLDEKKLKIINTSFFKYRKIMNDENVYKEVFLNELFESLKLVRPKLLSEVDFYKFDFALKEYGYEKAYNFLYVHLIIFCGMYMDEKTDYTGKWILDKNSFYPFSYIPVYEYGDGLSTKISLNHFLGKELIEAHKKNTNDKGGFILNIKNFINSNSDWKKFRGNISIPKND